MNDWGPSQADDDVAYISMVMRQVSWYMQRVRALSTKKVTWIFRVVPQTIGTTSVNDPPVVLVFVLVFIVLASSGPWPPKRVRAPSYALYNLCFHDGNGSLTKPGLRVGTILTRFWREFTRLVGN